MFLVLVKGLNLLAGGKEIVSEQPGAVEQKMGGIVPGWVGRNGGDGIVGRNCGRLRFGVLSQW